jgi:hypothetical protein
MSHPTAHITDKFNDRRVWMRGDEKTPHVTSRRIFIPLLFSG